MPTPWTHTGRMMVGARTLIKNISIGIFASFALGMRRPLCLALSIFAFAAVALVPPATSKTFTAKDMASLERISSPRVSPDGLSVLYEVRTVDYRANVASTSLWIIDLKTRVSRRLGISDGGATSGRWSPDGQHIYFVSERPPDGVAQVFRTDLSGEAATQVTTGPLKVGAFRIAPNGKTLVVSFAAFPDCTDVACTKSRLDAAKANRAAGVEYDHLFVRHWDKWADGTRNHLFALTLDAKGVASRPAIPLMNNFDGDAPPKPFGDDEDFVITPDSALVDFSAKASARDEAWTTNFDVWSVPIDGTRHPRDLTPDNRAWDGAPVFSYDARLSAYRAMKRPGFESDRFAIMLRDEATGAVREVAPRWDRSPNHLAWSPDGKRLYATAEDGGETRLFAVDVATGNVTPLTGEGHVGAFDVGPDNIVFSRDSLNGPAQLFSIGLSGGTAVQLTNANADALSEIHWGDREKFSFKGWNDETVHGYVMKPAEFEAGHKYPVAFLIHGGPQTSFGNGWSYRWNSQVFANAGYAVVVIDYHGSTGYGQAFTDAISQHWGDRPLQDLQKGWAFALSKYPFLDGTRACALGGSYGGYMINWMAGVWNQPWKCLVDHDGNFDLRGMGYSTEELWFDEWERGATFYDRPDLSERFNPINHVKAWSKPMLVIHGGRDYRIPLAQALGTFTTLQRRGIPSKFLYFPDENHWVLKPQNSVQWYSEVIGWLDRWTKD
jgi:dipeptidyl aminopeptidase/acylaminoacyl peptidase